MLTQVRRSADLVFKRGIPGPAAVQVIQVAPLDTQSPSAHVGRLAQVVGVAHSVDRRVLGATTDETALGRDDQVFGVGVQRVADQLFVGVGSVDVGRVDQGHTCFDRLSQQCDAAVTVGVFAPPVRAGEPQAP